MQTVITPVLGGKRCTKCGQVLPLTEFYVKNKVTGRRFSWCRSCHGLLTNPDRKLSGPTKRYKPPTETDAIGRCRLCGETRPRSQFGIKSSYCLPCLNSRDPKQVRREIEARYATKNPARAKERFRKFHQSHRLEINEKARNSRAKEPWRSCDAAKRYRKTHPAVVLKYTRKRRAKKLAAEGSHTIEEWRAVKAKYGNRCLCCGRPESIVKLTADHVVPLTKGGSDSASNLQPLCQRCNSRKHRQFIEYRPDHLLPP